MAFSNSIRAQLIAEKRKEIDLFSREIPPGALKVIKNEENSAQITFHSSLRGYIIVEL